MPKPNYERSQAPAEEPLSVAEAKEHMKVRTDSQDDYIERLITAARSYLESQWGLALVTQEWTVTFDEIPDRGLRLRPFPVQELVEVAVYQTDEFVAQTLSGFELVEGRPALLFAAVGTTLTSSRTRHGLRARFEAGFGAAEDVPADIKQAMLLLIGHWFENREASVSATTGFGVSADLTRGVEDLMAPYRSPRLV